MRLRRARYVALFLVAVASAAGSLPALLASRTTPVLGAPAPTAAMSPRDAAIPAAQADASPADGAADAGHLHCGRGGVFCAGAATGDITPPITSPQWAYTARNCAEASAADAGSHLAPNGDPSGLQPHLEEGQAWLLKGGPTCVANRVEPDTDLYAKEWPQTIGTFGRLQANAYVLDDGKGQRLAIVQADLGGIPGELHTYVASQVAALGIDRAHLLISATHDHGSVGGMWLGQGYALLGGDEYDPRVFTAVGTGIINAIRTANANLTPAKMAYGFGTITDANHNRDTGSQCLDQEFQGTTDCGGSATPQYAVNAPRLMVMRLDTREGLPIGVISNFANHGVIVGALNLYFTGDNQGATTRDVARAITADALSRGIKFPPGWKVVDSLINGAVGDITPVADHGNWPDSSFETYGDSHEYDDPDFREFAQMENAGNRQTPEALRLWRALGSQLSTKVTLDARLDFVCMCSQAVPDDPYDPYDAYNSDGTPISTTGDPLYNHVSTNAVLGAGGISDAPDPWHQQIPAPPSPLPGGVIPQYLPGPEPSLGPCNFLNCFATTVIPAHHLERPTLTASAGVSPYNARVQVIRINDLALAGMPGEPTIQMGRRIETSILAADQAAARASHSKPIFKNAITIGLANDYASYFPTQQEYEAYHYEGSFSLFGQQTGNVLKARLVDLATRIQTGTPVDACSLARSCFEPPDSLAPTMTPEPLVPDLNVGTIEVQPAPVQRFGVASFQWVGGGPGAEWSQGQPMAQVQVCPGGDAPFCDTHDTWQTVYSDLDTEVLIHYEKTNGLNHWKAMFDTTKDFAPGKYRFLVTGHYAKAPATTAPYTVTTAPYTLRSNSFQVAPYSGMTVTRLLDKNGNPTDNFEVDYPAPVPSVTYRYRDKLATTATINGQYPAFFSLSPGQTLVIPVGGLVDAWGNFNGTVITLSG